MFCNFQDNFVSKEGKSKHQLWQELCLLISRNPDKISSLKVEPIIRGGLQRFTDVIGQLWCSLADYFIRAGHFEKVSDDITGVVNKNCRCNQVQTPYS